MELSFDTLYAPDPSMVLGFRYDGDIVVSPAEPAGEMYVFDATGQIKQTIGRPGNGPGEFRRIAGITFDSSDTMFVVDTGNRRVTVYDVRYQMVRSFEAPPLRYVRHVAWADDSTLFLQAMGRTPELVGYYGHMVSRTGVHRPVIEGHGTVRGASGEFDARPTASRTDGGVWVGEQRELSVVAFDLYGDSIYGFSIPTNWESMNPEHADLYENYADTKPIFHGLTEDRSGDVLWLFTAEPQDPLPDVKIDGDFEWTDEFIARLADYHVIAFDPKGYRVVADEWYDYLPLRLTDRGLGYLGSRTDEEPSVAIVRLRLATPGRN